MRTSFSLPFFKMPRLTATQAKSAAAKRQPQEGVTTYFTPAGIEAGFLPFGSGKPAEVAYHALASAFGTSAVKFVHVVRDGIVYYVGCPAKGFINAPIGNSTTELAWALPGMSGDETAAVLTRSSFDQFAAIVRKDNSLSVYSGSLDEATRFIEINAPGIKPLTTPAEGSDEVERLPRWIGWDQSKTAETQKLGAMVIITLLVWSLTMAALWVGSGYVFASNISKSVNFRERANAAIQQAADAFKSSSQIRQNTVVLEEFDRLVALGVREDVLGTLRHFKATDGRVQAWEIAIPDYVPSKVYENLTADRVERRDGKLILSKGIVK